MHWLRCYRADLTGYLAQHPGFAAALEPVEAEQGAPGIVRDMTEAGRAAGVGPMAAVAGAIAQRVGGRLRRHSPEVIVENGGDIFLATAEARRVVIWAGDSPLSGRIALRIEPEATPLGVCTSSGTVGHSLSLGRADAAVVAARSAALADAAATALGNLVHGPADIEPALARICRIRGVHGALAIVGKHLGAQGRLVLEEVDGDESTS